MINPRNFKKPRRDDILVSLAGPASNIISAVLAAILWVFIYKLGYMQHWVNQVLWMIIIYNVNFAVFNMLPIPPLDGSRIVMNILPYNMARQYAQIERYSLFIFLIFIMAANTPILGSFLNIFIIPIIDFIRLLIAILVSI